MKFQISESQRKEIQGFYNSNKGNIAIVELLSLNENYAIFLDMLETFGKVWITTNYSLTTQTRF
jgi:hypothetical protein